MVSWYTSYKRTTRKRRADAPGDLVPNGRPRPSLRGNEGVNAQLCVPDTHVDTYKEHHARLFAKLEEEAPSLNFDGTTEKGETMPFRALKVRTRLCGRGRRRRCRLDLQDRA